MMQFDGDNFVQTLNASAEFGLRTLKGRLPSDRSYIKRSSFLQAQEARQTGLLRVCAWELGSLSPRRLVKSKELGKV